MYDPLERTTPIKQRHYTLQSRPFNILYIDERMQLEDVCVNICTKLAADFFNAIKAPNEDHYPIFIENLSTLSTIDRELLFMEIINRFTDQPIEVKLDAIDILTSINNQEAVNHFNNRLNSEMSELVRVKLCWILQNFGNTSSIIPLENAVLFDDCPMVRISAIDALAFLCSESSIGVIKEAEKNDQGNFDGMSVKEVAQTAIRHLKVKI